MHGARPIPNGGPFDDEGPAVIPLIRNSLDHGDVARLLESRRAPKPKNLAKGPKKKKKGAFGEAYTPVASGKKGERVQESRGGTERFVETVLKDPAKLKRVLTSFRASKFFTEAGRFREKAPAGWEGAVKSMKKHKDIDNPWALAHYMKNQGFQSHESEEYDDSEIDRSASGLTA